MSDIINYYIGAFDALFSYVNPIWHTDFNYVLTFLIVVSACSAITITMCFWAVKNAITAFVNHFRGL